jgi:hypothetical protein
MHRLNLLRQRKAIPGEAVPQDPKIARTVVTKYLCHIRASARMALLRSILFFRGGTARRNLLRRARYSWLFKINNKGLSHA